MTVRIAVTLEIREGGQVLVRHEMEGTEDPLEKADIFGLPHTDENDALTARVCRSLPDWVRKRFSQEAALAIERSKSPGKRAGRGQPPPETTAVKK